PLPLALPHPGSNRRWSRKELSYSYVNESRGQVTSAIVENHSQLEVIAAGLRQLSESLEVTSIHGSARLDFDTA
ncbi:MAG: hypothetical protein WBN74_00430, partial [Candidatus Sulfotelmatobacter sp.]